MVAELFSSSRLKVERAKKHILDLKRLLDCFIKSDFYSVRVEPYERKNSLWFDINKSLLSLTDAALITGDALHNLKSALDFLFNEIVLPSANPKARDERRFPVRNSRDEFVTTLHGLLEEQRISGPVYQLFTDSVCAYEGGNTALWALHKLDIADKHKLLIPVIGLMRFVEIRLENEKGEVVNPDVSYYMDETGRVMLDVGGHLVLKRKGKADATILFDVGMPYEGKPIIPALDGIGGEVLRTIEEFSLLLK